MAESPSSQMVIILRGNKTGSGSTGLPDPWGAAYAAASSVDQVKRLIVRGPP